MCMLIYSIFTLELSYVHLKFLFNSILNVMFSKSRNLISISSQHIMLWWLNSITFKKLIFDFSVLLLIYLDQPVFARILISTYKI